MENKFLIYQTPGQETTHFKIGVATAEWQEGFGWKTMKEIQQYTSEIKKTKPMVPNHRIYKVSRKKKKVFSFFAICMSWLVL